MTVDRRSLAIVLAATLGWPLAMSRWLLPDFYVALALLASSLLVAIAFVHRDRLRSWFALDGRGLAIGLAGGLLQAGLTHAGYHLVAVRIPAIRQQVVALYELMGTGMGPMRALPIVVLAIVVEELVWRGVAFDTPTGSEGTWIRRGLLSALLYTAAQAGSGSWALAATAFVCGWVWWGARVWGKSLTAPVLMHLVWSLVVLVFLPLETG